MSHAQFTQQDPTEQHAAPGSGDRTVEYPGRTGDMDVQPDHGEHSYRGTGQMPPGATIITSSSVQAFQPSPHLMDYAASKAAIVNFTKALGHDLVERGIRTNSVAPGPVWTPLIPATMAEDKLESFGAQVPMGRAAQPAELAPFSVFLASAGTDRRTAAGCH